MGGSISINVPGTITVNGLLGRDPLSVQIEGTDNPGSGPHCPAPPMMIYLKAVDGNKTMAKVAIPRMQKEILVKFPTMGLARHTKYKFILYSDDGWSAAIKAMSTEFEVNDLEAVMLQTALDNIRAEEAAEERKRERRRQDERNAAIRAANTKAQMEALKRKQEAQRKREFDAIMRRAEQELAERNEAQRRKALADARIRSAIRRAQESRENHAAAERRKNAIVKYFNRDKLKIMKDYYNQIDQDGRDGISPRELMAFVKKPQFGVTLTNDQIGIMFKRADTDGDKEISFVEFVAMMKDADKHNAGLHWGMLWCMVETHFDENRIAPRPRPAKRPRGDDFGVPSYKHPKVAQTFESALRVAGVPSKDVTTLKKMDMCNDGLKGFSLGDIIELGVKGRAALLVKTTVASFF